MICPRCSVAEISPLTNRCELCGFAPDGSVAVDAQSPDAVDEIARKELGHLFHFDALLGMGQGSVVYLAREVGGGSHLVLKARQRPPLRRDEVDDRFQRAADIARGLDHPHIVPVMGCGATESVCWYTMEHQRSSSLRLILATRGPLDVRSCQRIVAQVASALDHAHRRGIVHGDLKPENVLIDQDGWVRVCDTLVGRALETPLPGRQEPRPAHVAPEDWIEGMRAPAADQWALGVLVYECFTGAPPVAPDPSSPDGVTPLEAARPDLPVYITQAVRRAMSQKPADRFPSVLDFVAALEAPSQMSLPGARPSGHTSAAILMIPDWEPPPRLPVPLRKALLAFGALAVLAIGAVALPRILPKRGRAVYDAGPVRPLAPPAQAAVDSAPDTTILQPVPRQQRATRSERPAPSRPATRTTSTRTAAAPPATVQAEPPAPAPAPATEGVQGRLSVNASPWGQLYIDGQFVGNTPRANLVVLPGTHTIRVTREGFEPVERTVQVGAGQTVRITDIVLTERRP